MRQPVERATRRDQHHPTSASFDETLAEVMRQLQVSGAVETDDSLKVCQVMGEEVPGQPGPGVGHQQPHVEIGGRSDQLGGTVRLGEIDCHHAMLDPVGRRQLAAKCGESSCAACRQHDVEA
jgi:hypothetical protein